MGKRPKFLLKGAAVHVPTGISLFFIPVRGREFAENGKRHGLSCPLWPRPSSLTTPRVRASHASRS